MLPNIPQVQGSSEERKLCKIYKNLDSVDRQTLLSFADFLSTQASPIDGKIDEALLLKPLNIARPEKESVIKAIRRLSETYPMLDKDSMFDKISNLMTEHIMSGRKASSVIDELEEIFADKYVALDYG